MVENRSLKHMDFIGNIRPTMTRCRRSPTGSQLHCTSLLWRNGIFSAKS